MGSRRGDSRHGLGWRRDPLRSEALDSALGDSHFADSEPVGHVDTPLRTDHLLIRSGGGRSWLHRSRLSFNQFAMRYPARLTLLVFTFLIAVTTLLLSLPIANTGRHFTPFIDALFTAVSAVCVTGLSVVDTATYWSGFGQAVIAAGIALGGLGVMTMASLLTLAVSRRLGLTQRLMAQDDTQGRMGDAVTLVKAVFITTVIAEVVLFLVIAPAFLRQGRPFLTSVWDALFISISSFNNAGFVNMEGGVAPYVSDWFVLLPLVLAAFVGAIGFPVFVDLRRNWRKPRSLSLHSKITITTYISLAVITGLIIAALEWNNPYTFGALDFSGKSLSTIVGAINTRSLGVSAIDVSQMTGASWLVQDISMFIGGGSASHAGGIKVTTFTILLLAAWAEARGRRDVEAFHRRLPLGTIRQAVAVLLAAVVLVLGASAVLLVITPFTLDRIIFEVISAFGTVGLSTGITSALPPAAKFVLSLLMVIGRIGPMTFAAGLALREKQSFLRLPEERPIVG
ncbi:TrkH family potassium uptake protein [Actinomyces minihominis]|uniref:TrkH family potassium uptake protein n=1 Tax=Actinomyces minihominis TaxID=2002838 RepID=UPI000C06D749|nr:potassium transporter TrkG [Actinomyces minihominis]